MASEWPDDICLKIIEAMLGFLKPAVLSCADLALPSLEFFLQLAQSFLTLPLQGSLL